MFEKIVNIIRNQYSGQKQIPLHEPYFNGNEKDYLLKCIDSTFVSSVGKYVNKIEDDFAEFVGAKYAVATVNGTAALHIALLLVGVNPGDDVIIQPLTFVATANSIAYCGAMPVFIDVDRNTLGLSPEKLEDFLKKHTEWNSSISKQINKLTTRPISACIPMHTFGHPTRIDEIVDICNKYHIPVIEDSAESVGSFYKNKHTGTFGDIGIFSLNGNKIITCGGGGIIVTDDEKIAKKAKHLTTTAKIPHKWEYKHDVVGYNYRMPNINAALACAQMEQLEEFIKFKRNLAHKYKKSFDTINVNFFSEPENARSNYWLNAIILNSNEEREKFLEYTNNKGIQTRPAWTLMNKLEMFKACLSENLDNAEWLADRIVNIPSSITT